MATWHKTSRAPVKDSGRETSETASTYDPLGTIPCLDGGRAPASFAVELGATAGSRYRLLGTLGKGGMGVVYRAEDTRLGRTVAVKTIPAARTANPWAKERFLNEARAASALDHPNLCTIYEIEETGSGQLFLTMPCYDGETLRSRLRRGPLPLPEALHIAQQAARGLAKVHALGMVHCDLKPANLMLTADGLVKILDFGIARLSGPSPQLRTGPYGTPGYRSPEQARGEEVDASSDVWSLGVILYEMVTGRLPERDEGGEALPWEELDPRARQLANAPPELGRILSRMLARRADARYKDAATLLNDLEHIASQTSHGTENWHARTDGQAIRAAVLSIALLCLAILGGFFARTGRSFSPQPTTRHPLLIESTVSQITDFPGRASFPSLSPDGSTVVYVRALEGRSHIFSQPAIRGAAATDLSANSPAADTQPSFSPDGQQIAFRSERDGGGIFLMPATGGPVRRLTNFGFHPAWSPDGREIGCSTASIASPQVRRTSSEAFRIDVATGARLRITSGDAAQPTWSPHGQRIAYWSFFPQTGKRVIWTVPARGGQPIALINDGHLNWNPVWSPDGRYLYFGSDRSGILNLWRVPIDEASGRALGEPEQITASQEPDMLPSLSGDGRLIAYASDASRGILERLRFEPTTGRVLDPPSVIVQSTGMIFRCGASSDGKWLLYQLASPRDEIYIIHPDGTGMRQLIGEDYKSRLPEFSPDSSRIVFYSNRSGNYELWTIGVDGRGLTQETDIRSESVTTPCWSPDGKMIACEIAGSEALVNLTIPLEKRVPWFLPHPDEHSGFIAYSWSRDGKWLAGARQRPDGSHYPGLLLYSIAERKYLQLTREGGGAYWLHDGRRLIYAEGSKILVLDTLTGASKLILTCPVGSICRDISSSPDDQFLYLSQTVYDGHIWLLQVR